MGETGMYSVDLYGIPASKKPEKIPELRVLFDFDLELPLTWTIYTIFKFECRKCLPAKPAEVRGNSACARFNRDITTYERCY